MSAQGGKVYRILANGLRVAAEIAQQFFNQQLIIQFIEFFLPRFGVLVA